MNIDKIISILELDIECSNNNIKETFSDTVQIRRNIINEHRLRFTKSSLDLIKQHKKYIGTNVYKFLNNIRYTSIDDISQIDNWNKVDTVATLFDDILFNTFVKELIESRIIFFITELTENTNTQNSSNKLDNIFFEFKLEENQQLLKFFKSLLNNN